MKFNSDLLDEYCEEEGYADWEMSFDKEGNPVVTFLKKPKPVKVRMRDDLALEGVTIPACYSYSDYDTMDEPIIYLSAQDMEGAIEFDNKVDSDDHAFCVVKLKDGRVVYMIGIDLDWSKD